MQGDCGTLRSSFFLDFFPIHKFIVHRAKIINFRQLDDQSLTIIRDCFNLLLESRLDLGLENYILVHHFYMGLNIATTKYLTLASGGSFFESPSLVLVNDT